MQRSRQVFSCSVIAILTILITASYSCTAYGEGFLKGRIKEKLKDRILKKLEDQPAPESSTDVTSKITKPGDYTFSLQHDGLTRMYKIHVPGSYDPAKAAPLLLAFHGGGGDMEVQSTEKYYHEISTSEKEGNIVIFPNGYSNFKSGKLATWNAGNCCAGARDENIDDVGFVRKIIANVTGQLNIDRNRIFATGMSNGGMLVHRLACEMSDTFKAVVSVTGTDGTSNCNPQNPVSVMHIHAKDDDHVLFNGGAGKGAFPDESKVADFVSVPETISRWVKRNDCNPMPKRVLDNPGAYCDLYSQCKNNVEVELCVTETGGHSWPGGTKPRQNKSTVAPSTAISANDVMWDFFNRQK